MIPRLDQFSTVFNTYEEREEAFRRSVGFKLARRYAGPAVFWQDFSRITREGIAREENGHVVYIPSNPRDCLAFGTPHQVLLAAAMGSEKTGPNGMAAVLETAAAFGIEEQLKQPIRTLSGGETVKLALAKAYVSLPTCSRTVIASPFTWLSATNRHLLKTLVAESWRRNKSLSLLLLAGEEDLSLIHDKDPFLAPFPDRLTFSLTLSAVRIPLSLSLNPLVSELSHAAIQDTSLQLASPCLLVGDNGQGKSLVARTLAGAIAARGSTEIISGPQKPGPVCLLFQDVLTQTMLRSFKALTFGVDGAATRKIYEAMKKDFDAVLQRFNNSGTLRINDWESALHDLLDIKAVLVAARLASAPAALILDEPDWGMSRQSAIAFVSAVTAAAHRQNTAVLLISHKPWWQPIAASRIRVCRTLRRGNHELIDPAFTITLTAAEAAH
jgi:energy-coupling factor transporter ATP-binding protein EcfA2